MNQLLFPIFLALALSSCDVKSLENQALSQEADVKEFCSVTIAKLSSIRVQRTCNNSALNRFAYSEAAVVPDAWPALMAEMSNLGFTQKQCDTIATPGVSDVMMICLFEK